MDTVILGALLGGGAGILISWAMIFAYHMIRAGSAKRRGATPKRRVDPSAWEPMFGRAHGDWYRWFAWRPVSTLDRGWVWLRFVWRRRVYKKPYLPGPQTSWYQNLVELRYIYD